MKQLEITAPLLRPIEEFRNDYAVYYQASIESRFSLLIQYIEDTQVLAYDSIMDSYNKKLVSKLLIWPIEMERTPETDNAFERVEALAAFMGLKAEEVIPTDMWRLALK